MVHTPSAVPQYCFQGGVMKISVKTVLAALLISAVPIVLAQDAATDVKKGAEATGHETKKVAKKTGAAPRKLPTKLAMPPKRQPKRPGTPQRPRRKPPRRVQKKRPTR